VRRITYAALSLVVVALAGCGKGDSPSWPGPPDPGADGTVAVENFAAYQQDVDETWEGSAATAALEFLRLDERTAKTTMLEERGGPEGTGPATVVVTLDGLLDDSVRAERWTLEFEPDGDNYVLAQATWAQRCQPGRGHQDFSPEACA
jgi:hypothetical protein